MTEESYYGEIEHLIKKSEINKRVRDIEANNNLITTYWNVGKLIVKAQGGASRAKYGNELIKKWSIRLTNLYGKGYNASNLRKFRQFYLAFEKCSPLGSKLNWSHYRELLIFKDENERNFYINLCIKNNLSKRELIKEIKSKAYERLIDKPRKIDIIIPNKPKITTDMKDPIIIPVDKEITSEHDLELSILANLEFFFKQLGDGFAYIGHQYKLSDGNKNYYIDILLFNVKLNCYIVVELKLRPLKKEDKAQMEYYIKLIDEQIKEVHHNKTIGIIINKESDAFIANFIRSEEIIPLTYKLEKI